ncbi:hypothetical protein RB594_001895 [Gaeumannomyces avenae]
MALDGASGIKREFAAMERGADREPRARTVEIADDGPAKRRSVSHGMPPQAPGLGSSSPFALRTATSAAFLANMDPTPRLAPADHSAGTEDRLYRATAPSARTFHPDASIVLLGIRGAGKSTLAIIASTALKRVMVDAENTFHDATSRSSVAYKKEHGSSEYQRRQAEILDGILAQHGNGAVITCSWLDRQVQATFQALAVTHPVVYVQRDAAAVRNHFHLLEPSKLRSLLDISGNVFRQCSNLDFFNLSEARVPCGSSPGTPSGTRSPAPYMTLKRAERCFIKFLFLVMPEGSVPLVESALPLAQVPVEQRMFTFAVTVPLSQLDPEDFDVKLIETGADALEVVVDNLDASATRLSPGSARKISQAVASLRRITAIPILYHVPFDTGGGNSQAGNPWLHLGAVEMGFRLGAEYVTTDLRLDDQQLQGLIGVKGRSRIIGHVHWEGDDPPSWRDPSWLEFYKRAQRLCCDVVRFTRRAITATDNFEIDQLRGAIAALDQPVLPLIAYNTGHLGRHSACFNQILTSVLPGGPLRPHDHQPQVSSSTATPSLTALQVTTALYSSYVYDEMKLYVLGANVDWSMSPPMHNAGLQALGIPHKYRPFSAQTASGLRDLITDPYFAGASVGLPFKVEIISLTDSLSRHARAIGAANTLIPVRHLNADGSVPEDAAMFNHRNRPGPVKALYGENTDWIGVLACIRRGLSPANAVRPHTSALVIGAGGMARAAVYAMMQIGVKNIAILNRTRKNAEHLIQHFTKLISRGGLSLLCGTDGTDTQFRIIESRDVPWPDEMRYPTIFVSCIPTHVLGNSPAPNFTIPPRWLNSPTGGVVVELAYKSLKTPLLEQIRAEAPRGWVAMDGLDLLPEQGFAQFELFTGRRAPRRLMRSELLRAYPNEEDGSNLAQSNSRLEAIGEQEP